LLIPSVTTRGELDEVEQRNIEEAIRWTMERRKKFTADEVLTEQFIKELHQRMIGDVWKWPGTFRNSNKNIGIDKYEISTELRYALNIASCLFTVLQMAMDDIHALWEILLLRKYSEKRYFPGADMILLKQENFVQPI
jgi:fido (protein-threonine AMPylation protein)